MIKALITLIKNFFIGLPTGQTGRIQKMLSDNQGNVSSLRVCITLIIVTDCFNRVWSTVHGSYIPFNFADATTLFGILFAKRLQKGDELSAEPKCVTESEMSEEEPETK